MCTVVILHRPGTSWPVMIAANRDERVDRPADPPGRWWPDRADVLAGRDRLADGSWLGVNDAGVVAAMLNRSGTLGPAPGKRSRGELVLEALDHADAADAAEALTALNPAAYRPFNMVIADSRDVLWLRHTGQGVEVYPVPPGLSLLTARDLNDAADPRIARHRPLFLELPVPDPAAEAWQPWIAALGAGPALSREDALCLPIEGGFGTVSASLVAIPELPGRTTPVGLWHAEGPPDTTAFARLQ
ncbi:MAG: hypothetical protein EAZ99_11675 [Alphaproteobacteria bacterium]|nr:MAG: hypothetical protein EAZ99_11675 [Alphaproteobacteria bacterium]